MATTALLSPAGDGLVEVFGCLVDTVQRRAVIDSRTRVLGPGHPDTLVSRGILATVPRQRGRLTDAEAEIRSAVDTMTQVPGAGRPFTLHTRGHYARILRDQGRLEEAGPEIREVVKAITQVPGPDHPSTMINQTHLALVLHDLGQPDEAEPEISAALNFRYPRDGLLGPGHPGTTALASALRALRTPPKSPPPQEA
jgi:hypothetical protein